MLKHSVYRRRRRFPAMPALAAMAAFFLGACASLAGTKPPPDLGDFPLRSYAAENINGDFPEAVYIKTRTQTFNAYHYYVLKDGKIWYKSIDPRKKPFEWVLFGKTGLPHNLWKWSFRKPAAVAEISADADELVALSVEGAFYRYCFDRTIAHKSNVWLDRQGWPREDRLYIDGRFENNRAWAMGKRNRHVLYYEDPFGNQHHNGTMEIATTYVLLEDGQEICYADPGLPPDFSRNYAGPERGAFRAAALSASASTVFLINDAGEMYTRIADFDIVGCDPMLFKYTYIPYKSNLAGTNYFSNLTEWALPSEDWRSQPRIPLSGKAALTRYITILQNGYGNGARELRVAGLDEHGRTGYWTKAVFAPSWEFIPAPLYFPEGAFLEAVDRGERGISPDRSFTGFLWKGNERKEPECTIPNFNILEGDCDLRISLGGETCTVKLHPVELWTYVRRDYLPGRKGPPKLFFVTLDVPENAYDGLSPEFAGALREQFTVKDKVVFQYIMAASENYVLVVDKTNTGDVLFLTDGVLSQNLPEFQRRRYAGDYEELGRYLSPELTLEGKTSLAGGDRGELERKIALNKSLRRELRERIVSLRYDHLSAVSLDMMYLPLHYFIILTPLRFLDVPKIRTITTHGNNIVMANSVYIDMVSTTRIWIDRKIIDFLDVRIKCYEEVEDLLAKGAESAGVPPWYSEDIAAYWDAAGLPRRIEGVFFDPFAPGAGQIPAVLNFRENEERRETFGWYLSLGEEEDRPFFLFIDPQKSLKTIYSRNGRTPGQRAVHLGCTLHVNPSADGGPERRIAERCLAPLMRTSRPGVDVRIVFDGSTFEIRTWPSGAPLFRGQVSY
ncbi:MAG: hypothetical protein LBL44_13255 [Treponema sp.]|nr:hypothetical protein [Treponema sp.]